MHPYIITLGGLAAALFALLLALGVARHEVTDDLVCQGRVLKSSTSLFLISEYCHEEFVV